MNEKERSNIRRNIRLAHSILCLTVAPFSINDAVLTFHSNYPDMKISQREVTERVYAMAEAGVLVSLPNGYVPRGVFNRNRYNFLRA